MDDERLAMSPAALATLLPSSPPGRRRAATISSASTPTRPAETLRRQLSGLSLADGTNDAAGGEHAASGGTGRTSTHLALPTATPNRLRSGSLTLPKNSVADAFGNAVFSRSWTPIDNSSGQRSPAIREEELRSVGSNESIDDPADTAGTLAHLGLHGGASSPTAQSVPIITLDDQVQMDSPNRHRATTIAAFNRPNAGKGHGVLPNTSPSSSSQPQQIYEHYGSVGGPAAMRPRAATMGLAQSEGRNVPLAAPSLSASASNSSSYHEADRGAPPAVDSLSEHPPWLSNEPPIPPLVDDGAPTNTLFISHLDGHTTAHDLIQLLAAYGSIADFRMLPNRQALVSFASLLSAAAARDDIVGRLAGRIARTPDVVAHVSFCDPRALALDHVSTTHASAMDHTPTRALWISTIPKSASPADVLLPFSPWGPIESARVLTHKQCAFVNWERLEDAVRARKALNGREIFGSEVGPVKIGFAKVPSKPTTGDSGALDASYTVDVHTAGNAGAYPVARRDLSPYAPSEHPSSSSLMLQMMSDAHDGRTPPDSAPDPSSAASVADLQRLMRALDPDDPAVTRDVDAVASLPPPQSYYTAVPLPPGSGHETGRPQYRGRYADTNDLRDLRRRLDGASLPQSDIDGLVYELLDDAAVLASDAVGNVILQKLYERASLHARLALLKRIAPHLASIGIHRNGTWAAQKIIELACAPEEVDLICRHLRPFLPPLLLDQFGNYVVSGLLRFQSPSSDFVYDAVCSRCWTIGSGRFGARSTRSMLESPYTSRFQQKRVAMSLILNAAILATSPNGNLLLNWLLDTSQLPGRYSLLAPRLAPGLAHLATHKLASSVCLKILSNRTDLRARDVMLSSLFDVEGTLEDILSDQNQGALFVQRTLASLEQDRWAGYVERTRQALVGLKLEASPAYAHLLAPPEAYASNQAMLGAIHPSRGRGRQSSPRGASARASPRPAVRPSTPSAWTTAMPFVPSPPFLAGPMLPFSAGPALPPMSSTTHAANGLPSQFPPYSLQHGVLFQSPAAT